MLKYTQGKIITTPHLLPGGEFTGKIGEKMDLKKLKIEEDEEVSWSVAYNKVKL